MSKFLATWIKFHQQGHSGGHGDQNHGDHSDQKHGDHGDQKHGDVLTKHPRVEDEEELDSEEDVVQDWDSDSDDGL